MTTDKTHKTDDGKKDPLSDTDKFRNMLKKVTKTETIQQDAQAPLPPDTTAQEDIVTQRQSRINLIWEATQALIATMITLSVIYCTIYKIDNEVLTNAFFLVVSMYYIRTNHTRQGGVGQKPEESRST